MPLPARAENTKPALKMVKMAKPLAFSRIFLGMTPSRPLLVLSTKDLTVVVGQGGGGWQMVCAHILAAFSHSFGRDWGRGLLSFMRDSYKSAPGVGHAQHPDSFILSLAQPLESQINHACHLSGDTQPFWIESGPQKRIPSICQLFLYSRVLQHAGQQIFLLFLREIRYSLGFRLVGSCPRFCYRDTLSTNGKYDRSFISKLSFSSVLLQVFLLRLESSRTTGTADSHNRLDRLCRAQFLLMPRL